MEKFNLKMEILPNEFLKENGCFDRKRAINLCGKIAGVCYDREGFNNLLNEPIEKTNRRIDMTLNNGHHSVYDHIYISLNIQNIPKILSMIINNEHQYTTSEKSARYTPVVATKNEIITPLEQDLYDKWLDIFKNKIKGKYGDLYNDSKIHKLAQENARYLVTSFMPTQMIYTTSLRQINYLASWMAEYVLRTKTSVLKEKLSMAMNEFVISLAQLDVLEYGLTQNEKHRKLSLFGKDLAGTTDYFNDIYSTIYKGSLAQLAQAQRHRTLDYQMEFLNEKHYFVPPIIEDSAYLVNEWNSDIHRVKDVTPQGELVLIKETGKYEDFILKCKERLCTCAQLEIMYQTKETLLKYKKSLQEQNSPLAADIEKYSHGARCTFKDFECSSDCKFNDGKTLTRKI